MTTSSTSSTNVRKRKTLSENDNAIQRRKQRNRAKELRAKASSLCNEWSDLKRNLEVLDNKYKHLLETRKMNEKYFRDYEKRTNEASTIKDYIISSNAKVQRAQGRELEKIISNLDEELPDLKQKIEIEKDNYENLFESYERNESGFAPDLSFADDLFMGENNTNNINNNGNNNSDDIESNRNESNDLSMGDNNTNNQNQLNNNADIDFTSLLNNDDLDSLFNSLFNNDDLDNSLFNSLLSTMMM
ncbi:476_t:CDS:2 [Ambispora leptoticha]|uniref:476_t:CDS:1 n=1 Tax=Ambispora leptoticha TaxID=144679 RepID=A0A9N8W381_9GLOM|nr:476_t:CDS:2 [Ambispora leptoticha]